MDYVEFYRGGGCRIIEKNLTEERAEELSAEIDEFNKEHSTQNCYRALCY